MARWGVFLAWFLTLHNLAMGWWAAVGRTVLELAGIVTGEEDVPGRIVGVVLLLGALLMVQIWRGGVLPPGANVAGNGYAWGNKLVWLGNVLALLFFLFPFAHHAGLIESRMLLMILSKFMIAFAYIAIGICAVGFSLLYQSSQPAEK